MLKQTNKGKHDEKVRDIRRHERKWAASLDRRNSCERELDAHRNIYE